MKTEVPALQRFGILLYTCTGCIFIIIHTDKSAKKPEERGALKPLASNKRTALEAAKKEVICVPIIKY